MIVNIKYHQLYELIVHSSISLDNAFTQIAVENYSELLEYLVEKMGMNYSFFPEGMQPDSEIGRPIIPSKVQYRLGACIYMLTIYGKYDPDGLEKGFEHIRENELYQIDRLSYSSELFR